MDKKFKQKYLHYNRFAHYAYDIYQKVRKNIYWNSFPLNNNENYEPFFIVGCGRSGNTLLRRIMTTKTGVVIPPETYVLGKIIRLHKAYKNLKWYNYVNLVISTIEYHNQFYTFEINSLKELALELKDLSKDKRSLAHILNRFYCFYAEKKGLEIKYWGDKTPMNAMSVYEIKEVFPNAKFVHLIRDGIDVSYSYMNSGLMEYTAAALKWKRVVKFVQNFGKKNPENYLEIRYEGLVTKPDEIVRRVCGFLDIEYNEKMLYIENDANDLGDVKYLSHHKNVHNKISSKSIGKGKRNLTPTELKKLKPLINGLYKKLGY